MASPTLSIGGVACSVYFGSDPENAIVESVAEGQGPRAKVRLKCAYGSRYTLLKGLGGSSTRVGGKTVRTMPFAYPPSPNLYCVGIESITGLKESTGSDGWATYQYAIVSAVFGVPAFQFDASTSNDPSGQPWTTTRIRISAEVLQPPGGTYFYTTGSQAGTLVDGSLAGIVRCKSEVSMTRHWLPYIPVSAILSGIGTVNLSPVTLGDQSYPKGCLLFAGGNASETVDTLGNVVYEVEYVFLGNDTDWNTILDRSGSWVVINTKADGSGSYPYAYQDVLSTLP